MNDLSGEVGGPDPPTSKVAGTGRDRSAGTET